MKPLAYYSEIDPYAADWLENLILVGLIAPGDVDRRSIEDVTPNDLRGYTQCHFFAGIGVWSYALRCAGWPDDRPVWTGSCPCQPFSAAGRGRGTADERHLWPAWFWLIEQCRPRVVFGEQVEAAIKHDWLDLVQTDLEGIGYATGAVGLPAAGVGAPHGRARLWFVADDDDDDEDGRRRLTTPRVHGRRPGTGGDESAARSADGQPGDDALRCGADGELADRERAGLEGHAGHGDERHQPGRVGADATRPAAEGGGTFWSSCDWLPCRDGKARPVEPGSFPLVDGSAFKLGSGSSLQGKARVGMLRAYGNAIVPQVAAEVVRAYMEMRA